MEMNQTYCVPLKNQLFANYNNAIGMDLVYVAGFSWWKPKISY